MFLNGLSQSYAGRLNVECVFKNDGRWLEIQKLDWSELNEEVPSVVDLALIFTDFPTGSGSQPCALLEICEYQSHP